MDLIGNSAQNPKYITLFTEYQRKMWYTLSQAAVTRYYHLRDSKGRYCITRIGLVSLTIIWLIWINNIIKIMYLLLTYHEFLGVEVHFLDQMSMWDWFLALLHIAFEFNMWRPKYPMYEILYSQWEVQEDIFRKLGRPLEAAKKIKWTDVFNTHYYSTVVFCGTFSFIIQFLYTPKYALYTYAIVPLSWDSWWLQSIFCLHEAVLVYQGYALQACTMVVGESKATSYQHLLEEMTQAVYKLIKAGDVQMKPEDSSSNADIGDEMKLQTLDSFSASSRKRKQSSTEKLISKGRRRTFDLDPKAKAPGTDYDIEMLMRDYTRVMLASNASNSWVGWWMGGAEAFSYAQFVSDVFIMIQLSKEPDFDLFGISYYAMDACFGMCMLFRMLILLSRLVPASEEFIQGIKLYIMYKTPLRKYIMKRLPTMRVVGAKLTGYTVRPQSVPGGINLLINWYICAAMWKRPDDPTRRT